MFIDGLDWCLFGFFLTDFALGITIVVLRMGRDILYIWSFEYILVGLWVGAA